MKILGVLGSPRRDGNCELLLDQALAGAQAGGAEVEKLLLRDKNLKGCANCQSCKSTGICAIQDDMQRIYPQILEADCIIHSAPVYFGGMTSQMKTYLDRWHAFFDLKWNLHPHISPHLKGKKIAVITLCAGPDPKEAQSIVDCFKNASAMAYCNYIGEFMAAASAKGEVLKDAAALRNAYKLGLQAAQLENQPV